VTYAALATDYDGTLATGGVVAPHVEAALHDLARRGVHLVLVTGRIFEDLKRVFPAFRVFDRVVAENGAVLCDPHDDSERTLAAPPPRGLVRELSLRGVRPLSVGRVVVATDEEHRETVQRVLRDLDVDRQLVSNKGALMVLPRATDKGTGLGHALRELGVEEKDTVGVGDAENDVALLESCGVGVAVRGAVPELQRVASWVTEGSAGEGVLEVARLVSRG
jgi:hydroxymethylpyrimidine pyrophosphatase-like HAD family hydrolase